MLRLMIGVLLLPTACASLWAAGRAVADVAFAARDTFPFLAGFFGYPAFHLLAFRPVRLYVFGHELTHALAAWMHGASVTSFVVGRRGGHVDLTHSNAAIALAPYVLPLYAILVVLCYRGAVWLHPVPAAGARFAHGVFLAAIGGSLSFHLVHTAQSLWDARQPDLDQAGGLVFSLAIIAFANGLFLILTLKCLFPDAVEAGRYAALVWLVSSGFWKAVFAAGKSWACSAALRRPPGKA